jgi:hypothetical protein
VTHPPPPHPPTQELVNFRYEEITKPRHPRLQKLSESPFC